MGCTQKIGSKTTRRYVFTYEGTWGRAEEAGALTRTERQEPVDHAKDLPFPTWFVTWSFVSSLFTRGLG